MAKGDRTLANHVGRLKDVVKQLNLSDSILGQCVGLLKSLQAVSALPRACTEASEQILTPQCCVLCLLLLLMRSTRLRANLRQCGQSRTADVDHRR